MKWRKLGHLFDPHEHRLPDGCTAFAQSPQALVFDDFLRIYFSTRRADVNGQYLSYVTYVEVDRDMRSVLRIADRSVMSLGALGTFDEHGIFPMNIVRHGAEVRADASRRRADLRAFPPLPPRSDGQAPQAPHQRRPRGPLVAPAGAAGVRRPAGGSSPVETPSHG